MSDKKEHTAPDPAQTEASETTSEGANDAPGGNEGETAAGEVRESSELTALRQELEMANVRATEFQDRYLRAMAEADNARRRAEQDVANAHKYAIDKFAVEVLSVRDSLELARAVEIKSDDSEALAKMHEGIDLTLKQIDSVFEKFNLVVMNPQGEKFDPEYHQAMSMVESDDVEPNHILTVVQKGCLLNDRLIRPAMVIVARAKVENKADSA